jgi:hypothetical protein
VGLLIDSGYAVQAGFVGVRPGSGPGSGGDPQPVVGGLFTVGEDHPLLDRIDPNGAYTELPPGVHRTTARQRDVLRAHPPEQHLLGQRWSVVRGVRLLPDQGQRSGEAFLAQRLGSPQTGQRPADDDPALADHEAPGPAGSPTRMACTGQAASARRTRSC